jgi:hypothetical protein
MPGSDAPPSDRQAGQASIEVLAGIPALLVAGLVALQLLAAGYALSLADGAAEAGAMALAAGRPAAPAIRQALPGWAHDRVAVHVDGGELTVRLRPPSPSAEVARRLEVSSSAWVKRPAGG